MTQRTPEKIDVNADRLLIKWSGGAEKTYPARLLRQMCPCAHCISEFTREVLLDRSHISEDTKIHHAEPTGHYALNFTFSDGHSTGIYTYAFLADMQA